MQMSTGVKLTTTSDLFWQGSSHPFLTSEKQKLPISNGQMEEHHPQNWFEIADFPVLNEISV